MMVTGKTATLTTSSPPLRKGQAATQAFLTRLDRKPRIRVYFTASKDLLPTIGYVLQRCRHTTLSKAA